MHHVNIAPRGKGGGKIPKFDELLRKYPKSFDQGCLKTPSIGKRVLNITKLRETLWIYRYINLKKVTRCYLVTIIFFPRSEANR